MCSEEGDTWVSDGKLESHTDWVRDVAWAPSIGLPVSRIASCSQDGGVIVWRKDDTEGETWTPQVNTMAMACILSHVRMTMWAHGMCGTNKLLDAIPSMAAGHLVMPSYCVLTEVHK